MITFIVGWFIVGMSISILFGMIAHYGETGKR